MNSLELKDLIILKMNEIRRDITLHPLYEAILLESCENTILLKEAEHFDEDTLIVTSLSLFEMSKADMKGLIAGAMRAGDQLNIDYSSQSYFFYINSPIVISAFND